MTYRVKSKYRAKPTRVDNIRFHSAKEARRYGELKLLEKAGEIVALVLQPRFPLHAWSGDHAEAPFVGVYTADFEYLDCHGRRIVEDVKGCQTPMYRWKKKHMLAQYGITILET